MLLALTFLSSPLDGQQANLKFRHLTVEDGLPAASANCILQDRQGYIWIGTEGGLCRYDGVRFEYFPRRMRDSSIQNGVLITCLALDSAGTVWIGTDLGVCTLDVEDRCIKGLDSESLLDSAGWVTALACDRKDRVWIATARGVFVMDLRRESSISLRKELISGSSMSSDTVYSIAIDRQNFAWLGSEAGLDRLDLEQMSVTSHLSSALEATDGLSSNVVHSLLVDSKNTLWIGTYDGLDVLGVDDGKIRKHLLRSAVHAADPKNYIAAVCEDAYGDIWFGGPSGLYHYVRNRDSLVHVMNDPYDPASLLSNQVISLMVDQGGTLWVGSRKGVSSFSPFANKFTVFKNQPNNPNSLRNNRVWSFDLDGEDRLWIGTTDGIDLFDRRASSFNHSIQNSDERWSITKEFVLPILLDRHGDRWFGTWTSGLVKMSKRGTFSRHTIGSSDVDFRGILSLLEDRRGVLWVGTRKGLFNFDRTAERFVKPEMGKSDALAMERGIFCIFEDRDGILWFGTSDLLVRFDPEVGALSSVSSPIINSICQPSQKRDELFVSTVAGLDIYDVDDLRKRSSHLGVAEGLPSDNVNGVLEHPDGRFWLSTSRGLARYDSKMGAIRTYDVHDGLPGNELLNQAFLKSPSGEMFFGGNNGFVSFFPGELRDNPHVPPVVISSFRVFERGGKEMLLAAEASSQLELAYTQNTFSFDFAALDYAMPERNRYAFKLEGFENEWRTVANDQRSGMYTNLDPGEYTLRVKGSNGDGAWNETGASVGIRIAPPLWATWYFRGGTAGLLVLLAASFYSYRIKKIARVNLELESKVHDRTRELHRSNQELSLYKNNLEAQVRERTLELERIVMTLEAEVASRERIQRELISYQKDLQHLASDLSKSEERERRRIATFLHDVVGQTLFFCKMKLGSLKGGAHEAELTKVHGLVQDLLNEVQSLTFDLSPPVLYELGLDEAIVWLIEQLGRTHPAEISYQRNDHLSVVSEETRFVVFTAARELLTNALKHANAAHVDVSLVVEEPGVIRLSVVDDGTGFEPSEILGSAAGRRSTAGGFGLFNVKERLTFLGGSLKIDSGPGRGTAADLILPLNGRNEQPRAQHITQSQRKVQP